MSILKTENLTKIYNQRRVVDEVSIEIHSGEVVGLLGRNGAGKTTTFQLIVGLIRPDEGDIFLDSQKISNKPTYLRAREGISYLPQEDSVFLKATVEENLRMILELLFYPKKEIKEKTTQLLTELGIAHLVKSPAYTLSGGEKRRLEICRALILEPKFLLLDEPFTGIDPLTIAEIQKIILYLKTKKIGIIISDHNVRDTFEITDRAYIIHQGKILIEGKPVELANNLLAKEKFLGEDFHLGEEVKVKD
ncbi:MAG: LPS export ABC transporter ATP-binding protein [Candidatus Aminicenantia bacterium]